MLQSRGVLVKTPDVTVWRGTTATWNVDLGAFGWVSYAEIYRRQLWVSVLVSKRARALARLPLKVYTRTAQGGRDEAGDHPYADLLRQPNGLHDPFTFWQWAASTRDVFGEAFLGKVRDAGGRPVELIPMHPVNVHSEVRDGRVRWWFDDGETVIDNIARRDLIHFRSYNPSSTTRGLSPLEPLRATLENEDGARRANSALWRNGGRPSVFLQHPKSLSDTAMKRLGAQWRDFHGGVDNWAKAAILEEGMEAKTVALNAEELQYVECRKLNREEVCAVYDVPPPVVHILDRATFSNITEQMRSMYRDTMAPFLKSFESTLQHELRDGRFGDRRAQPDFGDTVYAEFLMDEVLRGDFEVRAQAYNTGVNSGWLMPSEVREKENLPFVEGSDVLLVNSTLVPVDQASAPPEPVPVAPPPLQVVRSLMGRLGRAKTLADVDIDGLCETVNGAEPEIRAAYDTAGDLDEFKAALRLLAKEAT